MIDANKFCVYIHELPDGRKYIGMTSRKPEHRFHKDGSGYRNNIEFYSEIQKIGWENIKHIIVISGLSLQEAAQLEIELIREYETTNPENGFNFVCGAMKNKSRKTKKRNEDLPEKLIHLRTEKGMSQEELAKRVGVTQSAIWQYENGEATPKIKIAVDIARQLGVTVEALVGMEV